MTAIKEELADTYFSSSLFRIANVDTVDIVIYHTITLLVKDILCLVITESAQFAFFLLRRELNKYQVVKKRNTHIDC